MDDSIEASDNTLPQSARWAWLARAACAALLWLLAIGAHAAPIYKCVDAHGSVAFQDTPCAAHTRQMEIAAAAQPLIDPAAPPSATATRADRPATPRTATRSSRRVAATHSQRNKPAVSWECRAANGEVFYRHARCPSSVPGDGVVRSRYAEKMSSRRMRGRHDAWSSVRVHAVKVSRAEACRRIHAAGAAGRDGHMRDDNVSVYDRLNGRDPCNNA